MRSGPLVSVLTPVYNGEPYIADCIESIRAQTYVNWDYTVVDNASTDATSDIVRSYVAQDPRIRHLRFDEFVDATANHNRAFDAINAESEFCKIVQADDWLYPECLARMVEASGSPTVGIISSYRLSGLRVDLAGLPHDTTWVPGREILRRTLLGRFNVTGGPTATMLRSAFVRERQSFYQEGLRHEDTEAMLWMLSRHDFAFVHQVLSYERQQPDSRFGWSERMNSHAAEDIVFLLRYGRLVLDDAEYRARLRACLKRYLWWHIRQFPRVSRLRDPEFFEFQQSRRRLILAEAQGDPDVRVAMGLLKTLLLRGAIHSPSVPTTSSSTFDADRSS